jgi:hypothetical protein
LKSSDPVLIVDGWLTNTADTQRIVLNYTQPYFDSNQPPHAVNALVNVVETETDFAYSFTDADDNGVYEWIPTSGEKFGTIGNNYELQIELTDGSVYYSTSRMDSVPAIDSITFEYNVADAFIEDDYYYAEFWARDLAGRGNTYWIKAFKNDVFYSSPEFINFAYDAGFSAGGEVDSLIFIQPIRTFINDFGSEDEKGNPTSPYKFGDKLKVEIHAISEEAWFFLTRVFDEANPQSGFGQLFASPVANSPSNIVTIQGVAQAVGFFSVAAVSSMEVTMSDALVVDRVPD